MFRGEFYLRIQSCNFYRRLLKWNKIGFFIHLNTYVTCGGVLIRDGKILVQRDSNGFEYALPGGHVKIGETTVDSIIREYKEETEADIKCSRLLWTEECFWKWNGVKAHNIAFYYLIELCDGSDIPDTGEFVSHKDNCEVVLGWMPIEKLSEITIYPRFIKEKINCLDEAPQHFISYE